MTFGAVREAQREQLILQVWFSLGISHVHRRQLHSTDVKPLCQRAHVIIVPVHTGLPQAWEYTQAEEGPLKGFLCATLASPFFQTAG